MASNKSDSDKRKARAMLSRMIASSQWRKDRDPRMGLRIALEFMKLADLTPDEERRERERLEIDELEKAVVTA